tara:strand:- start:361 stop:618 length:258 start_codon:yes stop_codon:yes gene_type:complete
MNHNNIVKEYAKKFKYKKLIHSAIETKEIFVKNIGNEFLVMESDKDSKYVNFYFNENFKTFKKGDLFLGIIENTPLAWEVENVRI